MSFIQSSQINPIGYGIFMAMADTETLELPLSGPPHPKPGILIDYKGLNEFLGRKDKKDAFKWGEVVQHLVGHITFLDGRQTVPGLDTTKEAWKYFLRHMPMNKPPSDEEWRSLFAYNPRQPVEGEPTLAEEIAGFLELD